MPTKLDTDRLLLALCFAQGSTTAPEWIELVPAPDAGGLVHGRDGRSWIMRDPAKVLAWQRQQTRDLVLDWEHSTELKAEKGEEAPAAAWLPELRVSQAGAIEARADWTARGRNSVEAREYRYISPVLIYDKETREIVGLSSAGLTNKQNLFNRALNQEGAPNPTTDTMNPEQLKALCQALGLTAESTPDQIIAAAKAKTSDLAAALNRAETPSLEKFVPRADYDAALTRANNAETSLKTMAQEKLIAEVETEVAAAMKAGKITPATKDFYVAMCKQEGGLESFRKFVAAAPVIGDPAKISPVVPEGADKALNAEELAVAKAMGIDPEAVKKTKSEAA